MQGAGEAALWQLILLWMAPNWNYRCRLDSCSPNYVYVKFIILQPMVFSSPSDRVSIADVY